MKKIIKKLNIYFIKNKKLFLLFLFCSVFFLIPGGGLEAQNNPVSQTLGGAVALLIGWISYIINGVLGNLSVLLIKVIVSIAQFNKIINVSAVQVGWTTVRDICNMFFILVLLVIAFGTILRIESYNAKKMLPKLLLMAVLINFSKTIFGLIIDFGQVIMLTFVNGFSNGGGWFVDGFDIKNIYTMPGESILLDKYTDNWAVVTGIIAGTFALIVTVIVLVVLIGVLAMRIIMLWIYTILSPLFFFGMALPALQKYTGKIWEDFIKAVITGPMLAFFIWLALTTAKLSSEELSNTSLVQRTAETAKICAGAGSFFCDQSLQNFIIFIGLMLGGLMVTQSIGGAAGSIAGKGMGWVRKAGSGALKGAAGATIVPAKALGSYGIDKLHQKTGYDLNVSRAWSTLKEKRQEKRRERYSEGMEEAGRKMEQGNRVQGFLAMSGSPGDAYDKVTEFKGKKPQGLIHLFRGGKSLQKEREKIGPKLNIAKFKEEFVNKTGDERDRINKKLIRRNDDIYYNLLPKAKEKGDKEEMAKLEKEQALNDGKIAFSNVKDKYGNRPRFTEGDKKKYKTEAEELQRQFDNNIPRKSFEARAADQDAVSKKMSKIKDISDSSELLRMLKDAISQHDKTMVKAISLKMSKDGNDNEFLQPLAGHTSHIGLKQLMRDFANKDSKNYAGFDQQEAFALGSQIAELNKATNHWAATSSYIMENGQWRETSDVEHNEIRSAETGKLHLQQIVRNINRLGFGEHDINGEFHIDEGGLMLLKKLDNVGGIKQLGDNMNESAAKHLNKNMDLLRKTGMFTDDLLGAIRERAKGLSMESFEEDYEKYKGRLATAKSGGDAGLDPGLERQNEEDKDKGAEK